MKQIDKKCKLNKHNYVKEGRVEKYNVVGNFIYLILFCTKCGKIIKQRIL